jgi:succinyl-diaminopimelate desuccinylase
LLARINLPMARVEIRTDEGGHPIDVDIANLTLKYLLLLMIYADKEFGRSFRYDQDDIERARRNETQAAKYGLKAEIENPFSSKPLKMREFLNWTLKQIEPLAKELGLWKDLLPLVNMASGSPNTAEQLRVRLRQEVGASNRVPVELLEQMALEREKQVNQDIEEIFGTTNQFESEAYKINEFLQKAQEDVSEDLHAPVRFISRQKMLLDAERFDKPGEILRLAEQLIKIPSVTASPHERVGEVRKAITFIMDYAISAGLAVRYFNENKYPAILLGFPDVKFAPVMLLGHVDVVEPDPDDSQFEPRIDGDYLWGRGSADMKTVVATYVVWMKDQLKSGNPNPPVNLLLIGNEENGESEPFGTPHVLKQLKLENNYSPKMVIAGERTGEHGDELWGDVCIQNRGVMRFDLVCKGIKGHTGTVSKPGGKGFGNITDRLLVAKSEIDRIATKYLTLESTDSWKSQITFPFLQVGTVGIYNISPDEGVLGIEIRPIPGDDIQALCEEISDFCNEHDLNMLLHIMESGIACDPENMYLTKLIAAVQMASGKAPKTGKKLPGTSARFAPLGQGVVWGQTGIGPHSSGERHFIPSIMPYYQALECYAGLLTELKGASRKSG